MGGHHVMAAQSSFNRALMVRVPCIAKCPTGQNGATARIPAMEAHSSVPVTSHVTAMLADFRAQHYSRSGLVVPTHAPFPVPCLHGVCGRRVRRRVVGAHKIDYDE